MGCGRVNRDSKVLIHTHGFVVTCVRCGLVVEDNGEILIGNKLVVSSVELLTLSFFETILFKLKVKVPIQVNIKVDFEKFY